MAIIWDLIWKKAVFLRSLLYMNKYILITNIPLSINSSRICTWLHLIYQIVQDEIKLHLFFLTKLLHVLCYLKLISPFNLEFIHIGHILCICDYFFSKNMILFKNMSVTIVYFIILAYQWYRKSLELAICLRICLFSLDIWK